MFGSTLKVIVSLTNAKWTWFYEASNCRGVSNVQFYKHKLTLLFKLLSIELSFTGLKSINLKISSFSRRKMQEQNKKTKRKEVIETTIKYLQ